MDKAASPVTFTQMVSLPLGGGFLKEPANTVPGCYFLLKTSGYDSNVKNYRSYDAILCPDVDTPAVYWHKSHINQ
jgi:hypothetical protein